MYLEQTNIRNILSRVRSSIMISVVRIYQWIDIFTSVSTADWTRSKNITIVGTMRLHRIGIPNSFKDISQREERSTSYIYSIDENNHMLVKKKSGKKMCLF